MPRYKGAHLTWNDRLTIEKMLREGAGQNQRRAERHSQQHAKPFHLDTSVTFLRTGRNSPKPATINTKTSISVQSAFTCRETPVLTEE